MRENHSRTISMRLSDEPQFDHPRSQQFRHETYIVGFLTGGSGHVDRFLYRYHRIA